MKALIWIGCLVGAAVIMTIFQHAIGAPLGPLAKTLLVGGAIALAVALCKKVPPKNEDIDDDDDEAYDRAEYDNEYIDTEYPDEKYPEYIEEYDDNVYDDDQYTAIDENEGYTAYIVKYNDHAYDDNKYTAVDENKGYNNKYTHNEYNDDEHNNKEYNDEHNNIKRISKLNMHKVAWIISIALLVVGILLMGKEVNTYSTYDYWVAKNYRHVYEQGTGQIVDYIEDDEVCQIKNNTIIVTRKKAGTVGYVLGGLITFTAACWIVGLIILNMPDNKNR